MPRLSVIEDIYSHEAIVMSPNQNMRLLAHTGLHTFGEKASYSSGLNGFIAFTLDQAHQMAGTFA